MPALSVIDLAMFLLETPERPFNIGPLIVLDPPASGRDTFADRLIARMLQAARSARPSTTGCRRRCSACLRWRSTRMPTRPRTCTA